MAARHQGRHVERAAHHGAAALCIVPRLTTTLVPDALLAPVGGVWGDTRLAVPPDVEDGPFTDVSRAMPPEQGRRYLAEMQRLTLGSHEQVEHSISNPEGHAHGHH